MNEKLDFKVAILAKVLWVISIVVVIIVCYLQYQLAVVMNGTMLIVLPIFIILASIFSMILISVIYMDVLRISLPNIKENTKCLS